MAMKNVHESHLKVKTGYHFKLIVRWKPVEQKKCLTTAAGISNDREASCVDPLYQAALLLIICFSCGATL